MIKFSFKNSKSATAIGYFLGNILLFQKISKSISEGELLRTCILLGDFVLGFLDMGKIVVRRSGWLLG